MRMAPTGECPSRRAPCRRWSSRLDNPPNSLGTDSALLRLTARGKSMQKHLLIVLALGSVPMVAQTPRLDCDGHSFHQDRLANHCEMKEQTLAAPKGAIRIDPGTNGGVTVKGWDRNDVWVRARIDTAAETDAEARSMVSSIRFASGAGQIRAEGPNMDDNHGWSVSYEIFAPRQSDLEMKTFNGGIHLADLRGTIDFEALNGGVTLERLAGQIHGHTTNGGLH